MLIVINLPELYDILYNDTQQSDTQQMALSMMALSIGYSYAECPFTLSVAIVMLGVIMLSVVALLCCTL
jgi:hypothetical protein